MDREPDHPIFFREDLFVVDENLAGLHEKVLESKRCPAGRCYICKVRHCVRVLLRRKEAANPVRRRFYEEKIRRNSVHYAVGVDSALRLAFISKHVDLGANRKAQRTARKLFERCGVMDPRESPSQNTNQLDRIHEWFTEALLRHVGCTNINRPNQANDPVVDFHFKAEEYQFSVECKRVKSEEALLGATARAKGQLEADSLVKTGEAHRLIALDCTPYIMSKVIKQHGGSLPVHGVETIIRKELSGVYETLATPPKQNREAIVEKRLAGFPKPSGETPRTPRQTMISNVCYNTMLFAALPCFTEELTHRSNLRIDLIQEWTGGSGAALGCLWNLAKKYEGCAKSPVRSSHILVPPTVLLVPDWDLFFP